MKTTCLSIVRRHVSRSRIATIAAFVSIGATALAADPTGEWLNVRDFGVSGSEFETTSETTAGSNQIVVKDVGDFKAGQGVMVSKCNPRCTQQQIWGPRGAVAMGRNLDGKAEIRGYDGSQGDWVILILDVPQGSPTVRWTEDLARTWHPTVPITGDWQPLRDGIEVRFNKHDWEKGYTVVFFRPRTIGHDHREDRGEHDHLARRPHANGHGRGTASL